MTEKVKKQLELLKKREYRTWRKDPPAFDESKLENVSDMQEKALLFEMTLDAEEPKFYGEDLFGFHFYRNATPLTTKKSSDGWGRFGNNTIDYETVLQIGLDGIADGMKTRYEDVDEKGKEFFDAFFLCHGACVRLVQRVREGAKEKGIDRLAAALVTVPQKGATDYYEALVTLRFMQYVLRLNAMPHVTIGRFDQYCKPYFEASKKAGATDEELLELTELFFIALNFDTDLYAGVQQGDNGQSMVLGGVDRAGNDAFNELSELCLQASEELKIIDPKINLRVNKNTPLSLYERATRLTKQGLGFPQYCNDDKVIDGLVALGYDLEDARDYTVAACWEYIVPRCGADIPNIGAFNYPLSVSNATERWLANCNTFDEFLQKVRDEMAKQADKLMATANSMLSTSEPFLSAFVSPCPVTGRDISRYGAKYNNYGMHGAGLSTAADALEAIRIAVFEEKKASPARLLAALKADFAGEEELQKYLLSLPKMGNNIDSVDELGGWLMMQYASLVNGKPNNRGGVFRAGSGSAMEYIRSARKVGATADGRNAGKPYSCSYAPALTAKSSGPLSAVLSFTKHDMKSVINGGPFTMEVHDTVFRNDEGERKVAMLVKAFIDRGGHQMQINAVNRDTLVDAQQHPEDYPNLIVRVWGWSGYFNELDIEYQNHVIARTEFTFG